MDIDIKYRPVNSLARVRLEAGESIEAEPGAMVGMSPHVDMQTGMNQSSSSGGGMLGKIANAAKSALGGESFFKNTFTARGRAGEVLLSQALSGDIVVETIPQHGLTMQSGAYIASTPAVEVESEMGSATTFFGGEGMFLLEAEAREPGQQVVLGAFGGIEKTPVSGSMVVDTGHMVAWESHLQLSTEKASGGWISSMLSGEGRVFKIRGEGNIWIQTRQPVEFGEQIGKQLPPKQQ